MPPRIRTNRLSDAQSVENASKRVTDVLRVAYVDALRATASGGDPRPAWSRYQKALTRSTVLMYLLGAASTYRGLLRKRLVPPAEEVDAQAPNGRADFALEVTGFTSQPFEAAVQVFAKEIPALEGVVAEILPLATEMAARRTAVEATEGISGVIDRVRSALATEAKQRGLTEVPIDAITRALTTAAGVRAIDSRLDTETRTVLMDSFNGGAKSQLEEHQDVIPVWRLDEIQDRRTRNNPNGLYPDAPPHFQMDGFMALTTDPIWDLITPPNGYNCRARLVGMTRPMLRRAGLLLDNGEVDTDTLSSRTTRQRAFVTSGEYPDPGFKSSALGSFGAAI